MKKIKKAMAMVLFCVLTFCICLSFVGCRKENKEKVFGDFIYTIVYYDEKGVEVVEEKGVRSAVRIMSLSEAGKEKEIIVFPEYIEGLKVESLGKSITWLGTYGVIESQNLRKIFFPYPISIASNVIQANESLQEVFILRNDKYERYISTGLSVFLTSYYASNKTNFYASDGYLNYYFSNVSYYYNYKTAPNDGYYWIDNYEYGERIEYIPENPLRNGYTFDGWYKESECVNVWDFETDRLPETQYNEEEQEIYQETKLYAKWIKN